VNARDAATEVDVEDEFVVAATQVLHERVARESDVSVTGTVAAGRVREPSSL
jgi:hypothetical protein